MSAAERIVAVAGEALVDLMPTGVPGQFQAVPGGSPANVAVGLARLRTPVRMLARLGADPLGGRIRKYLQDNDISLDHVVAAAEPTSLAVVDVDAMGTAHYDFRIDATADWQWTDAELAHAVDDAVVALHTGSLAMMLPPGAAPLLRLVERARRTATISYDPNFRPHLMARTTARERIEVLLQLADVIKVSAEDLAWLYPHTAPEDILVDWAAHGPALVVVTLGPDGCLAATGADPTPMYRSGKQVPVVDTVGAGDAFSAGLLAGLYRRDLLGADRRNALRDIAKSELTDVLDHATTVAAMTCARRGADPPTASEVCRKPV
ncbi:carbohydrate kinase [Nocardia vinacea]|uniref:carbohydrate kinase family protein n=1 Tax=Nocardia vinacea TaxID=96468 RepID=UPI0034473018